VIPRRFGECLDCAEAFNHARAGDAA
jgi:hypothetical protein